MQKALVIIPLSLVCVLIILECIRVRKWIYLKFRMLMYSRYEKKAAKWLRKQNKRK